MEEVQNKQVTEINMETIRNLRMSGRAHEAHLLLEAYRRDVKKVGKQAYNDCVKKDRLIKQSKGVCGVENCYNKTEDGKFRCKECADKKSIYDKNYNKKREKFINVC